MMCKTSPQLHRVAQSLTDVCVSPQLVCHSGVKQSDYSTALQDCNRSKNRNCSVIPGESMNTLSAQGEDV